MVFDKFIETPVSGMGVRTSRGHDLLATTLRRRRDEWIAVGAGEALRLATLAAYDRMVGLDLERLTADGCQTKASAGGECAGMSPVDRAKQGVKRSQLTEAYGIPLVTEPARADIRDHTLLPANLDDYNDLAKALGPLPEKPALSVDAGYDYQPVYADLGTRRITAKLVERGKQTPIQVDGRWIVERTNSWMNNFGKLRRCTERRRVCIEFFSALTAAITTIRSLIRRASPAQPPLKPPHPVTYWRTLSEATGSAPLLVGSGVEDIVVPAANIHDNPEGIVLLGQVVKTRRLLVPWCQRWESGAYLGRFMPDPRQVPAEAAEWSRDPPPSFGTTKGPRQRGGRPNSPGGPTHVRPRPHQAHCRRPRPPLPNIDDGGRLLTPATFWRSARNPLAQWSRIIDHFSHAYR